MKLSGSDLGRRLRKGVDVALEALYVVAAWEWAQPLSLALKYDQSTERTVGRQRRAGRGLRAATCGACAGVDTQERRWAQLS